ncbi:MAG TPA: DUF302 domain-containing protein [Methylomirabilota bacterium]|nr:DUF302 domain-containing protein [Methylomirabilota bacterium]
MRLLSLVLLALLTLPASARATGGLLAKRSSYPVAETMDRLERAVRDRQLSVVARVDHAAAAQKAGLTLRPTQLLIFGNPKAGTPLMQSAQSIGIDLPLKALVWEDEKGQVWLAYNDPAWLAARHDVTDRAEVVRAISGALDALSDAATKAAR